MVEPYRYPWIPELTPMKATRSFKRSVRPKILINRFKEPPLIRYTEEIEVVFPPAAAGAAETEHP